QLRRALEVPSVRGLLHLLLERGQDFLAASAEEEGGTIDRLPVRLLIRGSDARREALAEMVVETDALAAGDVLLALAEREEPVEQVQRPVGVARGRIRSEIAA